MLLGKKSYYKKIKVDDYVKNEDRALMSELVYLAPSRLSPIII
jgi:hypothetical protein